MSDASYCAHQYRRDVETCPWCDLAEAEQQLAAAQEQARLAHIDWEVTQQELSAAQERIAALEAERDVYRQHADYWREHRLQDEPTHQLQHVAMEYLPDWAWLDLGFASTAYCWWRRLESLLERVPPEARP